MPILFAGEGGAEHSKRIVGAAGGRRLPGEGALREVRRGPQRRALRRRAYETWAVLPFCTER